MGWNPEKCKEGGPDPFDPSAALSAADFSKSVYVNTSAKEGKTRQAYTYVNYGEYRICVVGHIHLDGEKVIPGNSFIPGWDDWQQQTPKAAVVIIADLSDTGTFPGEGRYPKKL